MAYMTPIRSLEINQKNKQKHNGNFSQSALTVNTLLVALRGHY